MSSAVAYLHPSRPSLTCHGPTVVSVNKQKHLIHLQAYEDHVRTRVTGELEKPASTMIPNQRPGKK